MSGKEKRSNCIHFISCDALSLIKIGRSADVNKRLSHLQISVGAELRIIKAVPADPWVEIAVHSKFQHIRVRGEWFRADKELLDFIANFKAPERTLSIGEEYRIEEDGGTVEPPTQLTLAAWLCRTGIESAAFARLAGLSPSAICLLAHGRRQPSLKTIIKINHIKRGRGG